MTTKKTDREIDLELKREKEVQKKINERHERDRVAEKVARERKPIHHCLTRRDFLSQGLIMGGGAFFTTGLSSLLTSNTANASLLQTHLGELVTANNPILSIDLAGGANLLGGGAVVGFADTENQLDVGTNSGSYIQLGIPSNLHPKNDANVDSQFGLKFHRSSGFRQGLIDGIGHDPNDPASPPDLAEYIDGVIACAVTADDSAANAINPLYAINHVANNRGKLVAAVGTQPNAYGGKSVGPAQDMKAAWRPSNISVGNAEADAAGLVSVGRNIMEPGILDALGPKGQFRLEKFMEIVGNITKKDMDRVVGGRHQNTLVANKIRSLANDSSKLFDTYGPEKLKPTDSEVVAHVQAIFGDGNGNISNNNMQHAAIMNLIVKGIATTGTIQIGGADYHNGTNMTGYNVDRNAGLAVARFFRMCHAEERNGVAYICTDGGVRGNTAGQLDPDNGNVVWQGDSGARSGIIILRYVHGVKRIDNPNGGSNLIYGKRQIGWYAENGGAQLGSSPFINSPHLLTRLITANYIASMLDTTDRDEARTIAGDIMIQKFGGDWKPSWNKYIRCC
ncbi:hypothetical protein N9N67_02175 [Bacteriovoracaceae bacterium]|nr:hypothetical protein [Bacteriovoracaceae bacterium]